ncbi:MAG TPA: RHS repeat-associated core domain-containing protein, partial [Acidobacteriaceae bacterium]|nr:RHS repeat-associated core domain-containing protein [Acidobacteriaceae bacterium]
SGYTGAPTGGGAGGGGLVFLKNRYYDPNTGSFTQADPIGLAGGLNLYGYAGNDPVLFTDPLGLSCPPICFPIFGSGGGAGGEAAAEAATGALNGSAAAAGGALLTGAAVIGIALEPAFPGPGTSASGIPSGAYVARDATAVYLHGSGAKPAGKVYRTARKALEALALLVGLKTSDQPPPSPDPDKNNPPPAAPSGRELSPVGGDSIPSTHQPER